MKYRYILMVGLFAIIKLHAAALTNGPGGGHFGDQLLLYCKTKWFCFKYNLPLYLKPFKFSHELMIHELEKPLSQAPKHLKRININHEKKLNPTRKKLYGITFDCQYIKRFSEKDNPDFFNLLRSYIRPKNTIEKISSPDNRKKVAVHVRTGAYGDPPLWSRQNYADKAWPLKFPPHDYYIKQIRSLSSMLNNIPLYIHIFTDHKNPSLIMKKYQDQIHNPNILFGCRHEDNRYDKNVIDDFFNMSTCDYLIRPESSYSRMAQRLGMHQIVISPAKYHWENKKLIIDTVRITTRDQ